MIILGVYLLLCIFLEEVRLTLTGLILVLILEVMFN